MCGIAGVIHFNEIPIVEANLYEAIDVISYRGPDGDGVWINEQRNVGLAHRRLAIIDIGDSGKQPMSYLNGRYHITFNGEIYNYLEIKDTLIESGYHFKTNSDTEVLLALYDLKKENCLADLDGMFAFAIYDNETQILFCARDRFGEKPFHYYLKNDCFVFSSEIKQIAKYLNDLKLNRDEFQKYLHSGFIAQKETTYVENVFSLLPGHYIIVENRTKTIHQFWDIDTNRRVNYLSNQDYIERFNELFQQSIYRRLRSDVSIGSCLSGGLDSSSIVCMISDITKKSFATFSARFNDQQKDEGKWISDVVNKTNVNNLQTYPDSLKFLNEVEKLLYHHEYPISSTSQYAQWCVYRLVNASNVKVLLDGQGADEYLAGYDDLKYFAIWELYRNMKISEFLKERSFLKLNWNNKSSVGMLFLLDPIINMLGLRRTVFNNGYTFKERLKHATTIELGELLRYGDRSSMAFSLEVRLPFLYHELVEFVFSLPNEMIYQHGATKYILREAMKGKIPDSIFTRYDKIGFAPPQNNWVTQPEYMIETITCKKHLMEHGFNPSNDIFRDIVGSHLLKAYIKMGIVIS